MEKEQELEWLEAQKIVISEDLIAAAKQQLQFLAMVDRNRCLYDGPVLYYAIYRYKACWLPLLAKQDESWISEGPLVVPLDCEWIWHCHRLNPVQYNADCEEFYGRILDYHNVVSTIQGASTKKTEEIWNRLYPEEPYKLDLSISLSKNIDEKFPEALRCTKYDLVSAVKRQSPFFYQVARPSMNDNLFLECAVARYKGFLHLIKRNRERSIKRFCVPTYDIDLIWHSHQLHPVSYCKDMMEALGKVLEHDDTDSDRTKGKKLDIGFSGTTKQWENTFGSRYWRAGAMHRGTAPSPVTVIPFTSNLVDKKVVSPNEHQKMTELPKTKFVEVLLEIVGIRNVPSGHDGNLFISFSKKQPDLFLNSTRWLSILSEYGEKQVSAFQCEPTGELFFELMSQSPSDISRPAKVMGTTSISLQDLLDPAYKLSMEKWFELAPRSGIGSKPIYLRIAISVTTPVLAPQVLNMVRSRPCLLNPGFFPLPGRVQHAKSWTSIVDETGNEIMNIQMREKTEVGTECVTMKEVIGITGSGETHVLAEFVETGWSLINSHGSFQLQKKPSEDGHIFELRGDPMVKLFPGRKLEFEPRNCERHKSDYDFMTVVEYTAEDPYGKALALFNLKSGILKVNKEWFVLPGITLAFILSDTMRKEGYSSFIANGDNIKEMACLSEDAENRDMTEKVGASNENCVKGECERLVKSGACGGGCGSGCGGGCGHMINSSACGGCGAGCGGGCGNAVKSGGCGGCGAGCGGGCGNAVKSGGCGGCGAGCGGNCGNSLPHNA